MATTKPKIKPVSEKNEMIRSLNGLEYIKNPFVYSQLRGNFSIVQQKVMISILSNLQAKINQQLIEGKGIQGELVSKDDRTFRIELQDLDLSTNQYEYLDTSIDALTKMSNIGFTYKDGEETRYRQMQIFSGYDIPVSRSKSDEKKGRRKGYVEITLNSDAVDPVFNQSNQYIEHVGNIALICRSPRTPRLYLYLSAFRKVSKERIVTYDSLKEYLGFVDYNSTHTKILEDRAPKFSIFKRDVIDPAQKELKKLCLEGKVDFYFDYEPVYDGKQPKPGEKQKVLKGKEPIKIRFVLIQGNGKVVETEYLNTKEDNKEKKTYVTGNSMGDSRLMRKLAESGNEWAKERMRLAAMAIGEEWDVERFEKELSDAGMLPRGV